jgi:hypothetical protein
MKQMQELWQILHLRAHLHKMQELRLLGLLPSYVHQVPLQGLCCSAQDGKSRWLERGLQAELRGAALV